MKALISRTGVFALSALLLAASASWGADLCRACLDRRLASIGEHLLYGQLGDSRHFAARQVAAKGPNML